MSGYSTRVGYARWYQDLNQISNSSMNVISTSAAGVTIPTGWQHEVCHIAATKTGTSTIKVWGMGSLSTTMQNKWVYLDTLEFNEANDEAKPLRGITGFRRLQTTTNSLSAGYVNTYFGFSE